MARSSVTVTEREGSGALLPIAIGGAVLYGVYKLFLKPKVIVPIQTKHFVQKLQITDAGFRLQLDHQRAILSFTINNPNTTAMKIQAIVGHVTIYQTDPKKTGFRIGDVDRFTPIEIRPMSSTKVDLVIQIKAVNSLAYVAQVLTGKWIGQIINFQGTITANNNAWPVNQTIKLG